MSDDENICYCIIHSPELFDYDCDCTYVEPLEDDVY